MANTLAIIPARGGSKSIPLKNLQEIAGRSLLAHAIDKCHEAKSVDRIIVSTDHDGIAEAARQLGAEVPFMRPPELSTDDIPLDPVIYHAVTALEELEGSRFEVVLTVQPTCPLLKPETVDRVVATLLEGEWDSVVTVQEMRHLLWRRAEGMTGQFVPMFPERVNRQYLEPVYRETGSQYSRRAVVTPHDHLGSRIGHFVVTDEEAIDIDTEIELRLAELLLESRNASSH